MRFSLWESKCWEGISLKDCPRRLPAAVSSPMTGQIFFLEKESEDEGGEIRFLDREEKLKRTVMAQS